MIPTCGSPGVTTRARQLLCVPFHFTAEPHHSQYAHQEKARGYYRCHPAVEKTESSQPLAPQTRGLSQTIFVFCTTTHSSPRMHSLKKPTNVDTHHLVYRVQVTASGCCAAHKAAHVFTPHRSLDSKKRKNKCRQTVHQARAPTTATTGLKRNLVDSTQG